MGVIRAIAALAVGAMGLGLLFAITCVVGVKNCDLPLIIISFVVGTACGVICLGPFALAEVFREPLSHWLGPYTFRIQWFVSLMMMTSMGYIFASMRYGRGDYILGIAVIIVFFGAMTKLFLAAVFESSPETPGRRLPPPEGAACGLPIGPRKPAPLVAHKTPDA